MKRQHYVMASFLAYALLTLAPASAAVKNWLDGTDFWSVGAKWSGGTVPAANDTVKIAFADGAARTITYNVNAPLQGFGLLYVDLTGAGGAAATLAIPGNNSLRANGIILGGHSGTAVTNGRGALIQSQGAVSINAGVDLILGYGAGSSGAYTLDGGELFNSQWEYVGYAGMGDFTHSGGTNTILPSAVGGLSLAHSPGVTGTYNLSGTGALSTATDQYIGYSGLGVFNQTGGTNTIAAGKSLYLGFNASGSGAYNLSAGIVTVPTTVVGNSGVGISTFLITGAGSRVNATTSFLVGKFATGELTLADGGTLAIGSGTQPLSIATLFSGSSFGRVKIGNGGAAGVLQASAVQFGNVLSRLEFNHTGSLAFTTPIQGAGFVQKYGPGTTTLSGTNTYTGVTQVNGGTLAISADANLGMAPGTFNVGQVLFGGGTLRATQSFTMAATRGIYFAPPGGTIEVDATKTLTYPNNLLLAIGKMTKTGAGTLSLGDMTVGAYPPIGPYQPAELLVTGGGTLSTGIFDLGQDNDTGMATISGPGSTVNNTYVTLGVSGFGYLNIIDGGTMNTAVDGHIARQFGTAIATVRGAGSTWTLGRDLHVNWSPDGAIGVLNIEDQALVYVGNTLNNDGAVVNLSGGTLRFNNYVEVNDGAFNFNSGTIQLAGSRSVGTDAAIAKFFGATPLIPAGKGLTVEGTGTLSKSLTINGGTFKANGLVIGAGGALHFDRGVLELTGGTITGLSNLSIPTNGEFRASGMQPLRITGAAGSTITATGNLTLGNAAAVNGFGTQGTLAVGANTVTLLDANDVVFDSLALVTIGNGASPGTLAATNGLTLNFGGNITGFGTVSTPNSFSKPLINNGHITGNSAAEKITLPGYVKGVGTLDNVNFTGTFSPGLSPTSLSVGNLAFSPTSTLIIELGGTSPGSGYDQILSSGALFLDGTLNVSLINGFSPTLGQFFNLFDWTSVSGTFNELTLPSLTGGLNWNTSQLYSTGILSIGAGLSGDFDHDGDVDGRDFLVWQRGGSPNGINSGDLALWQSQYGSPPLTTSATAVPEPSALGLMLIFLTMLCTTALRR